MRYGGYSDIRFRAKSGRKHCEGGRNVMIQNTPVSAKIIFVVYENAVMNLSEFKVKLSLCEVLTMVYDV